MGEEDSGFISGERAPDFRKQATAKNAQEISRKRARAMRTEKDFL